MESADATRVTGLLGWLEEEHHQHKAQLGRVQYQLEQLVNLAREQAGQIRALQEEVAATRSQMSRLLSLDDLLKELRENLSRLQSSHLQHVAETEKDEKGRQTEVERTRQAINEIWLRIDANYRELEPLLGKVQMINDFARRHEETIGGLSKNLDGFQQHAETLAARAQIAVDQSRRNESALESMGRQLDTLRGQDDVTLARLQILADKVKQMDEQIAAALAEEQKRLDLSERLQVLRLEQQRLEKQLTNIIPMVDIHAVRLDEQGRELRQVEDRRQLTADDIKELKQLVFDHIARLDNNLIVVEELEERHKRRQIAELEFQASDIKERIAKLKGQVQ